MICRAVVAEMDRLWDDETHDAVGNWFACLPGNLARLCGGKRSGTSSLIRYATKSNATKNRRNNMTITAPFCT